MKVALQKSPSLPKPRIAAADHSYDLQVVDQYDQTVGEAGVADDQASANRIS
ncbi:MAG: hypothetical protein U0528_05165 [Anaerolineae bacterium]